MLKKIRNEIEKHNMLEEGDHVLVGLSGGADSVALVHVLLELKDEYGLKISAVHVNHGLRGEEAHRDEMFTRSLCEGADISLRVYSYDINKEAERLKMTGEEAGRLMRYESFEKEARLIGANKIALAHNMNDNAETLLMRIIRGTGIKGLSGIAAVRGNIIRPLLECRRAEIEKYCAEKNIEYMDDSTNFENIYTRNKIRLNIIPYIERELNESVVETMSRMSGLIGEENKFLDELAEQAYKNCTAQKDDMISIEQLLKHHDVIKRRIIRLGFSKHSSDLKDLSYDHVNSILGMLSKPTGKSLNLPGGLQAEVQYGYLRFHKKDEEHNFSYEIDFEKPVYVSELKKYFCLSKKNFDLEGATTYNINCAQIKNGLSLRTRKPGDKIYIKNIEGTKKISSYFIDEKVPRQLRDKIPLLADGSHIILIMDRKGIFSDSYKGNGDDSTIYLKVYS